MPVKNSQMIIGLLGKAGSGKDTAADYLCTHYDYMKVSFADPLKRFCKDVFDFSDEQLWGPSEERNKPDPRYPVKQCAGCQICEFHCDHWYYLSPRQALQQLGTEWGRACYPNIWAEYALRIAKTLLYGREDDCPGGVPVYTRERGLTWEYLPRSGRAKGVVIPDCRFPNEVEEIKKAGGHVLKIVRGDGLSGIAGQHASEMDQEGIPPEAFSGVIQNSGTIEDLHSSISSWLLMQKGK